MIAHYEPFSEKEIRGVIIDWLEIEILHEKHKIFKGKTGK